MNVTKSTKALLGFALLAGIAIPAMANDEMRRCEMAKVASIVAEKGKLPKASPSLPEAITDVPEGEMSLWKRVSVETFPNPFGGGVLQGQYPGAVNKIIEGADGCVYFCFAVQDLHSDPIPWLQGVRDGDDIVFEFPQVGYQHGSTNYYAMCMEFEETTPGSGSGTLTLSDSQEFRLKKDGEGYVSGDNSYIGMCMIDGNEVSWTGYSATDLNLEPQTDEVITPPADMEVKRWGFSYSDGSDSKYVNVGFADGYMYMQGLNPRLPDSWIRGKYDSDVVFFENGQYTGIQESNWHYSYFMAVTSKEVWNEVVGDYLPTTVCDTSEGGVWSFIAKKDDEGRPTSIMWGQKTAFTTTATTFDYNYTDIIPGGASIQDLDNRDVEDAPHLPFISMALQQTQNHDGVIEFTIYSYDTSAVMLDPDNLYYNIFLDGELLELTPEEYGVKYNMTDIPVNFRDKYVDYSDNGWHSVKFFNPGVSKVGVRSVYINPDGSRVESYTTTKETELLKWAFVTEVNNPALVSVSPEKSEEGEDVDECTWLDFVITTTSDDVQIVKAMWNDTDVTSQIVDNPANPCRKMLTLQINDYSVLTLTATKSTGVDSIGANDDKKFDVISVDGVVVKRQVNTLDGLKPGLYIVNGEKIVVRN